MDKKTNSWHLRNINRNEYSDDINDKKLRRQNSNIDLNYLGLPIGTENSNINNQIGSRLNKRRSSSTSYLNEKDDYDNDENEYYSGEYLKKFRRQLSLEETDADKNESNQNENSSDDSLNSDTDIDSDCDLYAIDECDELIQALDNTIDHSSI